MTDRAAGNGRFADASPSARILLIVSVLGAVVLPTTTPVAYRTEVGLPAAVLIPIILLSSVVNIELARLLEERLPVAQRPHRALSVWGFVTAMTVAGPWLLLVVPACYLHAYWRGLRAPVWKLTGSAAFVIVAAFAARLSQTVTGGRPFTESSAAALLGMIAAILVFVAVEAALFAAAAWLNHAEQELWLRATLAGASFYVTEASLLAVGGLSIAVWARLPWLAGLLLPVYGLLQRGALFEPLRTEAIHDEKTNLLRFEAWRTRAVRSCRAAGDAARPWAVLMVDLDHFKRFNTDHGHLAADELLYAVGRALRSGLRPLDLACRFGGEEFAVLLVDADATAAAATAHRIRSEIAALPSPTVTVSVGVATVGADCRLGGGELHTALIAADRALSLAKADGRDQVKITDIADVPEPVPAAA